MEWGVAAYSVTLLSIFLSVASVQATKVNSVFTSRSHVTLGKSHSMMKTHSNFKTKAGTWKRGMVSLHQQCTSGADWNVPHTLQCMTPYSHRISAIHYFEMGTTSFLTSRCSGHSRSNREIITGCRLIKTKWPWANTVMCNWLQKSFIHLINFHNFFYIIFICGDVAVTLYILTVNFSLQNLGLGLHWRHAQMLQTKVISPNVTSTKSYTKF